MQETICSKLWVATYIKKKLELQENINFYIRVATYILKKKFRNARNFKKIEDIKFNKTEITNNLPHR